MATAGSAVIGLGFAKVDPRRAMTFSICAAIGGAVGIVGGVFVGSLAIMIALCWYTALTVLLAFISLVGQLRIKRAARRASGSGPGDETPCVSIELARQR